MQPNYEPLSFCGGDKFLDVVIPLVFGEHIGNFINVKILSENYLSYIRMLFDGE